MVTERRGQGDSQRFASSIPNQNLPLQGTCRRYSEGGDGPDVKRSRFSRGAPIWVDFTGPLSRDSSSP